MALKKTSFYHTRNKIIPNNKAAAELLGVDIAEIARMDKEGAPAVMERYILLWDSKRINSPGWDGWCFSRGSLMHKRMIWKPENLLNARREAERIGQLEAEIHKLYSLYGLIKITKKLIYKKIGRRYYR
ncbi:hypothetical protein [Methylobacter tundripaludum]|uniref:Uncharacterized protein n=1 Tax=Methylobacter tundripaludum (strain ATCC BAA-1195 / DSM 17260 / SV96) TaxID=697282 RepID=G3IYT9_METTV|nr:hypothetical protein [Methylobacter tundripaludum]EGW21240.1 hypothetical protein Mettu_4405 [Methylobacter tundripaludum SV96]